MQMEAWMTQQPAMEYWRLVSPVVIQDEMHVELRWHLGVDVVQEFSELRRAMPPMHFADDSAGRDVQGSKQRGRPVTRVVMRPPFSLTWPHRQDRLSAIERLDLAFLISTQDQCAIRRVQ